MFKPNSKYFEKFFYYSQIFLSLLIFSTPLLLYLIMVMETKDEKMISLFALFIAFSLSLPGIFPVYKVMMGKRSTKYENQSYDYFKYMFQKYKYFFKKSLLFSIIVTTILGVLYVDFKVVDSKIKLIFLLLIALVISIGQDMIFFMTAYDYGLKDALKRAKILVFDNLFINLSYEVFFLLVLFTALTYSGVIFGTIMVIVLIQWHLSIVKKQLSKSKILINEDSGK